MPLQAGQCLGVAAGGALGCLCRYLVQLSPLARCGQGASTLAVNLLGCLLIGLASALIERTGPAPWVRAMCVTGFLGGFTTYSTFALDTLQLGCAHSALRAAVYVAVTVAGGLLMCGLGRCAAARLL